MTRDPTCGTGYRDDISGGDIVDRFVRRDYVGVKILPSGG